MQTNVFQKIKSTVTVAAALVLFVFAACSDSDEERPVATPIPTPSPTALSPTPSASAIQPGMKTIDDLFADIAEQVPGFGGSFYDANDQSVLNVYLTDLSVDLSLVKQAILSTLNPNHFSIDPDITIHPLQGRYDWRDLKRWYDIRYSLPASPKITTTDMQEGKNRLEFGVANEDDIDDVTQAFLDAGVPADAFEVHVAAPFTDD